MNTNKILSNILMGGLFLVLFIPLFVSDSMFFPFITGKNFAFRIIVEILLGAWVVLAYRDPAYRPTRSPLFIAAASFVGILALAGALGENPYKSFWSNYERMEGTISLLHFFAYFVMTTTVLGARKKWGAFWNTSILVSFIIGIYALFQLSGALAINQGGVRVDATFGNAAYLAVYLLFHIFLTLFMLLREKGHTIGGMIAEKASLWIYTPIILLDVFVLYHTATRGAILGLIGGLLLTALLIAIFEKERVGLRKIALGILATTTLLVGGFLVAKYIQFVTLSRDALFLTIFGSCLILAGFVFTALLITIYEKECQRLQKIIVGLLAVGIILAGGFFARGNVQFIKESPVLSRFSSISLTEQTTKSRFMVWNMAYQGFKERPVLGWGQENFNFVFNKYYDPNMYGQEPWFDRAHNVFFDWLIAGGILGLLAYLSLFILALWYLWRRGSTFSVIEKSIFTGLLAGYFFQNIFVFDNLMSYVMFFTVLAYIESSRKRDVVPVLKKKNDKNAVSEPLDISIAPVAVIVVISLLYFCNAKPIATNFMLIEALQPQQKGPMVNLENFKKTFAYDSFGTGEGREQLSQVTMSLLGAEKIDNATKQAFVDLTVSELKKQADTHAQDARYQLFLGSFLNQLGRYNPASYDEALVHLEKAHELSPKKQAIIFEMGSLYYNKKDTAKAEELFKQAYELAPAYQEAENFYVRVLMDNKNYKEIERVLVAHVVRAPGEHDPHVKLSALYLELGRRADAVAELERAIELNPAFKEQGESYLKEIKAGRNP